MITLGTEVAGILRNVAGQEARNRLLGGTPRRIAIEEVEVDAAHLPHPGIVMREKEGGGRNPWPNLNRAFVAELAEWLAGR